MKIFKVEFDPLYPVGCCLIIAAENMEQAEEIANRTILHKTEMMDISEVNISEPCVVEYMSGDY